MHDIFENFSQALTQRQLIDAKTRFFGPPKPHSYLIKQFIYSITAMPMLIESLKRQNNLLTKDVFFDEEQLEVHTIRYVVDETEELWFAQEGETGPRVPAHSDMVNEADVLAAGNIVFSADYTRIIEINNKSGHYRPNFGSMIFVIKQLLSAQFTSLTSVILDDTILLADVNHGSEHRVSATDLHHFFADSVESKTSFTNYAKVRVEAGLLTILHSKEDYLKEFLRKASSATTTIAPSPLVKKSNQFLFAKSSSLFAPEPEETWEECANKQKKSKKLDGTVHDAKANQKNETYNSPLIRKSSLLTNRLFCYTSPEKENSRPFNGAISNLNFSA